MLNLSIIDKINQVEKWVAVAVASTLAAVLKQV